MAFPASFGASKHRLLEDSEPLHDLKRRRDNTRPPPAPPSFTEEVHARVNRFLCDKAWKIITHEQFLPLGEVYARQPAEVALSDIRNLEEWLGKNFSVEIREVMRTIVQRCFQVQAVPLMRTHVSVAAVCRLAQALLVEEGDQIYRISRDFSLYTNYEMRRVALYQSPEA